MTRKCPQCSSDFSEWRLAIQMWRPAFRCPACDARLTYAPRYTPTSKSDIIIGFSSRTVATQFPSSESVTFFKFVLLLLFLILYGYFEQKKVKIIFFDEIEQKKYREYISLPEKYGPIASFAAITAGALLLALGAIFLFMSTKPIESLFAVFMIAVGMSGFWIGKKISSKSGKT